MKRAVLLRRGALALGVTVLGVVALTGCTGASAASPSATSSSCDSTPRVPSGGGTTRESGALAIVVGGHANMPAGHLAGRAAAAAQQAVDNESHLAVVVADGKPYTMLNGSLTVRAANPVARKKKRRENRAGIDRAVVSAAAKTPETDLLAALELAARDIASVDGPHTVVVVDSGLSTAGELLNFTRTGMLDADPKEVAQALQKADQLPQLSGDDVIFQGLGDTAQPQGKLGTARRRHLVAIWTAVATAAGAARVEVEETPLEGTACAGLPKVTPVEIPTSAPCSGGTVTLAGGDVAFEPDSAEFLDPAAARATLKPIAGRMLAEHLTATLTGTTADVGPKDGQRELSRKRAQAVADVLVGLGVPAEDLTVVGLGSDFPGYVQDHDSAGNLLPGPAAANRKVTIQLSGSAGAVDCH